MRKAASRNLCFLCKNSLFLLYFTGRGFIGEGLGHVTDGSREVAVKSWGFQAKERVRAVI
ncbi:hypothetical protein QQP08_018906 [Theobroma cacao]|nr:hypothetical protein QQP08_018906 [Theobroma cacao]